MFEDHRLVDGGEFARDCDDSDLGGFVGGLHPFADAVEAELRLLASKAAR